MNLSTYFLTILTFTSIFGINVHAQGFLRASGKQIVNDKGENIQLKGIGLGGWMLQEPYMLKLSDVVIAQYDIKRKITDLAGEKGCSDFYKAWLSNMVSEKDIDSLARWGFNSIRLPMHYNLFTLPVGKEPVKGKNTWLEEGFNLTDNLLKWCSKNRIYLILDLHAAPGGQGNDKPIADIDTTRPRLWEDVLNKEKTVALWKKIASRYSDEKWIGGYDLINETNYQLPENKQLNELFREITKAIRLADKNHIIFIEGNGFANDFNGLTPPWDSNMAYSFHKYWSPTTFESISKFVKIRDDYNVPLWMGESGENNNDWYRDAVKLFENNNIGWCWWTLKKIGSSSGIMDVATPEGYQQIIDYWAGKAEKPSHEKVMAVLMQLAENVKLQNCKINYGVLKALFPDF
jgi:aryl-phospho-beta-D-glucosidase BglC (GH1 family)